jgi:hypothetical protein
MAMFIFKPVSQFLRMVSQRCGLCTEHGGFSFEEYFSNSVDNEDISKAF